MEWEEEKLAIVSKLLITQPELLLHEIDSNNAANNQFIKSWTALPSPVHADVATDVSSGANIRYCPTGWKGLDDALGGGVPDHEVLQILGNSNSGKTQVIINVAISAALNGMKVLLIDTSNSIFLPRLVKLVEYYLFLERQQKKFDDGEKLLLFNKTLTNIVIEKAFDVWSLLDLLTVINKDPSINLVAIDSLHNVIAPYLDCTEQSSSLYTSLGSRSLSFGVGIGKSDVSINTSQHAIVTPIISSLCLLLKTIASEKQLNRVRKNTFRSVVVSNVLDNSTLTRSISSIATNRPGQKVYCGTGTMSCFADVFNSFTVLLTLGNVLPNVQIARDRQYGTIITASKNTSQHFLPSIHNISDYK